jgi:hypothetical protein
LKTAIPQEHTSFGNSFEKTGATGGSAIPEKAHQSQGAQSAQAALKTRKVFAENA